MANLTNLMIFGINNSTMLLILMGVLLVFLVLMTVLGIVFIVALRKRAPVIKVLMAPPAPSASGEEEAEEDAVDDDDEPLPEPAPAPAAHSAEEEAAVTEEEAPQPAPAQEQPPIEIPDTVPDEIPEADDDTAVYVTEQHQRVRYDRSMLAKVAQLTNESKDWYTQIKNELLSYQRVKGRMSWKRESFRIGRTPIARLVVRGKTLCLLLGVDPAGFDGTKYKVEDVSTIASAADTPCQYRIKSARRMKYGKEIIAAVMKELGIHKNPDYVAADYFVPYEGTMSLMQRGLIKRVVSESARTFEIREVDADEAAAAQDEGEAPAEEQVETTAPAEETAETTTPDGGEE